MFSKRSIRASFLKQLILSSAILVFIFSLSLYFFIERSILNDRYQELLTYATNIVENRSLYDSSIASSEHYLEVKVEVVKLKVKNENIDFYETTKLNKTYLTLLYPYELSSLSYLKITKDITSTKDILKKILNYLIITNVAGFLLIIIYAIALSKMLIQPVKALSNKLANMNERLMKPLVIEELPEEFEPLGITINHLLNRIQNFIKYQKELFIGTAHELKTPLAVIKLKNQVTLLKQRESSEYIDAIKTTNKTVDEMNKIVSDVLNMGRQEGALLEAPQEIDVIEFLKSKAKDFTLLASSENKELKVNLEPSGYIASLQVTLLNQIIQNFLQNALKFTPEGKSVRLQSSLNSFGLLIEVIDEGKGVDETQDFFAPFKREGDKPGVGLGLFLAKNAADTIGAKIDLKNRVDGAQGSIASLNINSKLSCVLPV
ncbi:MAG: HAMP domain-containing sensor histidine kinase [Sulfurimonas sp.]|jgi:two-component system OmpR family sensor kinase|nr:HAMP domain-containing sensor histidine kinase [Sulfurimonadaceae bacterium]